MKKNMGKTDIRMRVFAALIIIALYLFNIISGVAAIILLIVAGIFIITSTISFCPLYTLFGISTCKNKSTTNL